MEAKTIWVAYIFILWYLTVEMVLRLEIWAAAFISEELALCMELCLDKFTLAAFCFPASEEAVLTAA